MLIFDNQGVSEYKEPCNEIRELAMGMPILVQLQHLVLTRVFATGSTGVQSDFGPEFDAQYGRYWTGMQMWGRSSVEYHPHVANLIILLNLQVRLVGDSAVIV